MSFFIFEAEFVVILRVPSGCAARLDSALGRVRTGCGGVVRRSDPWRRVVLVVYRPCDDRPIHVAFQVIDDHFLSDSRNPLVAPPSAGTRLRYSQPTRTHLIFRSITIPEELHFYPSIAIREDFIARRADHFRRLGGGHRVMQSWIAWPVGKASGNAGEPVAVSQWARIGGTCCNRLGTGMLDFRHHIEVRILKMTVQLELVSRSQLAKVAETSHHHASRLLLLHPQASDLRAFGHYLEPGLVDITLTVDLVEIFGKVARVIVYVHVYISGEAQLQILFVAGCSQRNAPPNELLRI